MPPKDNTYSTTISRNYFKNLPREPHSANDLQYLRTYSARKLSNTKAILVGYYFSINLREKKEKEISVA